MSAMRERRHRVPWTCVALSLLCLAWPMAAPAQTAASATSLDEQGLAHYEAGRYAQAADAFLRAFDLDPAPVLLYNAGRSLQRAGRLGEAVDVFERYLSVASATERHRGRVEGLLPDLTDKALTRQGRLRVTSRPAGASVYLDDATTPAGTTPLLVWLRYGSHNVRLEHEGHMPAFETVRLEMGRTTELPVSLTSAAQPASVAIVGLPSGTRVQIDRKYVGAAPFARPFELSAGVHSIRAQIREGLHEERIVEARPGETVRVAFRWPTSPPDESEERPVDLETEDPREGGGFRYSWYAWTTTGLTVAGLATGVAFHVLAADKAADAKSYSLLPEAQRDRWQRLVDASDDRMLYAYIGYGIAGASALATGLTLILENTGHREERAGVTIAPVMGGRGLEMSWTF